MRGAASLGRLQARLFRICVANRYKSSTAIESQFTDTIKNSILEHADSSRLWETEANSVNDAISHYDKLDDLHLNRPLQFHTLPVEDQTIDPFEIASAELSSLSESIRRDLLQTDHPVLNKAASYFFESQQGKKVRPMMVLLMSRALAHDAGGNIPLADTFLSQPLAWQRGDLVDSQRRLAEISEMIHTASLFHDDVIDSADVRRNLPAVHTVFGNKMAILAGDYLLARASICLARLRNLEVVEVMSTIIEHLVRGEVMQIKGTNKLDYYLKKNYYKTGSLMANSCKSAALLGEYSTELVDASYKYGKHVGMAFQLVDDVLDFEGSLSSLGKPALADLHAGLATAPVLFASEEFPELTPLMKRKFKKENDVDAAVEWIFQSSGIQRTKELAQMHAETAMESILVLRPSRYRDALVHLANKVVARTK